ncbi:MAG: phosphoglycolate phosphatase [Proteobacteria bacterium]|nr:phosphoglycolate phosphatase [Pseudomonadota bacterium]
MIAPATIAFDLDGTLVDTAPDLVAALNAVLLREGLAPVAYDKARPMIGGGARMLIERGFAAQGRTPQAPAIDRLYADFVAHYAEHIADLSLPFPGLEPALDALGRAGHRLVVCTNKLEWLSVRLLDALGLRSRFAAVCGQDTFGSPKPDPQMLRKTIAAGGGAVARAVMVGDSITDIATARAAGIPVIAVDFGYTDRPVASLGPDRVISHFRELGGAVDSLLET